MSDRPKVHQGLGALAGGLIGLALAAGIWGPDALGLRQSHLVLLYPSLLASVLTVAVLCALAGWAAARTTRKLAAPAIWLAAGLAAVLIAGHLPFEGRTFLAWLADRRFWGLPIYPFDQPAQLRLIFSGFFAVPLLIILGLLQDYRLEGIYGALDARWLGARAWLLLLLPLPLVFGAGLSTDSFVNAKLRDPVASVAQIIDTGRTYSGNLDDLSRGTGINYSALINVRASLSDRYTLMLGDISLGDENTVVVVATFDNGAWINCRTLVDRVSFCFDAHLPYTQGLAALLVGQDLGSCQDCAVQVSDEWRAWLLDQGGRHFTAAPQITRLGQWGSYVLMQARDAASAYAVQCLFHGSNTVGIVRCNVAPQV
jgi:hypothetical protein